MYLPCSAYGVRNNLIEEGIFSIQATPLGPNICRLEEPVDGDLDLILNDGGDWKNKWFREVKKWDPSDVECSRASRISIFEIPCYVRNKYF